MPAMATDYEKLLDATIQHLEGLRSHGIRHVTVSPEALRALAQPPPRIAQSAPAPVQPAFQKKFVAPQPVAALPTFTLPISVPIADSKPAPSPEAKTAAFAELRTRALACVKCPNLAAARKTVVFGVGNIDADLMFVGEAPGADEDEQGEPFVGKAGQLLTKIIETMGLQRSDVYIGNILKCRPDLPAGSASCPTCAKPFPTPA